MKKTRSSDRGPQKHHTLNWENRMSSYYCQGGNIVVSGTEQVETFLSLSEKFDRGPEKHKFCGIKELLNTLIDEDFHEYVLRSISGRITPYDIFTLHCFPPMHKNVTILCCKRSSFPSLHQKIKTLKNNFECVAFLRLH